jgi:tetrahydromethanopterin S-methyltransferase subunit G
LALTLREQLENVQKAIEKAEFSQEYSVNNRRNRRADLNILYKRQDELEKKIELFGADYIPANSKPIGRRARVVFTD